MRTWLSCVAGVSLLLSIGAPARADVIHYYACRADNEDQPSLVAIDETTKKVCDREFAEGWMTPTVFNAGNIEWGDGGATSKLIVHSRKGSRYEHHTYFIIVHIGHCNKVKAPATAPCQG